MQTYLEQAFGKSDICIGFGHKDILQHAQRNRT